jgi:serine/threonine protein kinase
VQIGPYELLNVLGTGGMGTVHRARDRATGELVAVKLLPPARVAEPVLLRRFEQECEAAMRLRHPHIVRGLRFGLHDGRPFLAMELIEGHTLNHLVSEGGPLPEAEAIRLAGQVADALDLAHRNRLVHRDVKPDNILVTRDGQAKLTDLGLVKNLEQADLSLTRSGTWLGTVAFMAPEQFGDARHVDARCDVYGLAATLFFALSGTEPFQGRGNLIILAKKLKNDHIPLRRLVPTVSPRVEVAIGLGLDKEPECRPASCGELIQMLGTSSRVGPVPTAQDRRRARRFPTALLGSCETVQGGGRQWPAQVVDVSLTGACLQVDEHFEPGAALRIALPAQPSGPTLDLVVRVRWVRQAGPRAWFVGGAFAEQLSEGELRTILGDKPATVALPHGGKTFHGAPPEG